MATITGTTNNSKYSFTCEYSFTQNTTANTSTITAIVYLNGNGYSTSSNYWCCTINGVEVTTNKSATIGGKTELGRRTWTVNHNGDGTCSTTISFSFSNRVSAGTYTVSSGSGSSNVTLTTIPRGSTISLNRSSATIGSDSITVTISRASSSFTHKVKLAWGNTWYLLAENVATSYSFTPPMSYCNTIPNATSGTATVKVETLNSSGSWVGEASKTITLNVPSSVAPTVGISVTANSAASSGAYVANQTTFTVKPTSAKGSYSSTIKSYSITGGGLNSSSSSGATTGKLGAGTYTFKVTVTDSRGRTASASKAVTVVGITAPTISANAYRCDSSGNKTQSGTYVKAGVTYKVDNTDSTNAKQYIMKWRTKGATSWTTYKTYTTLSAYSGTVTLDFGGDWATSKSYELYIGIKDSYTETGWQGTISTMSALLNLEKDGVGIGKIWESGALDVGGDLNVTGYIAISGSGKTLKTGASGSDVYICNTASSKFLQLKDDGRLCYSDNEIFHNGNATFSSSTVCQTWRYPNGMQVSIVKVSGTWNVSTAWGSIYSSPWIAGQSFDVAFLEAPKVMINAYNDNGTSIMVCQSGSPTTSATGAIYLWKPVSQTGIKTWIEYIAIGRWK